MQTPHALLQPHKSFAALIRTPFFSTRHTNKTAIPVAFCCDMPTVALLRPDKSALVPVFERATPIYSSNDSFHSPATRKTNSLPNSASSVNSSITRCSTLNLSLFTIPTVQSGPTTPITLYRNFDLQYEFLNLLEPAPVEPPQYSTLPPGGCPRFPTYNDGPDKIHFVSQKTYVLSLKSQPIVRNEINVPPKYTPAVYKITAIIRKVECLSPFEVAPIRRWKCCIMELNSTQLNFYLVPLILKERVLRFCANPVANKPPAKSKNYDSDIEERRSFMTSENDELIYQFCRSLGLITRPEIRGGTPLDESLPSYFASFRLKRLVRSYSLQHANIGLATDYKKRQNVLRTRIESEQTLLQFSSTQELIDWEVALSVGCGIALDISERKMPSFCTVPRRRRRYRGWSTMCDFRPIESPPSLITRISRRVLIGSLRYGSFRSLMLQVHSRLIKPDGRCKGKLESQQQSSLLVSDEAESQSSQLTRDPLSLESLPDDEASIRTYDEFLADLMDEEPDTGLDFELLSLSSILEYNALQTNLEFTSPTISSLETGQMKGDGWHKKTGDSPKNPSTHSTRQSSESKRVDYCRISAFTSQQLNYLKWTPLNDLRPSTLTIHRNCLRCIRPLTNYDQWVSKLVVKPAILSPFILRYLSFDSSSTNLMGFYGTKLPIDEYFHKNLDLVDYYLLLGNSATTNKRVRNSSIGKLNIFSPMMHIQKKGLTRVPCHFVREYIVGPHALIPKVV